MLIYQKWGGASDVEKILKINRIATTTSSFLITFKKGIVEKILKINRIATAVLSLKTWLSPC